MLRVFFDMDGVLAKWHPEAREKDLYEKGYFINLEPTPYVEMVKEFIKDPEMDVFILSNFLIFSSYAYFEKWEWIDKYLPEIPGHHRLFIPTLNSKADGVIGGLRPADILIDDYSKNLFSWNEKGAIGIKAHNEVNNRHGSWKGLHINPTDDPKEVIRVIKALVK